MKNKKAKTTSRIFATVLYNLIFPAVSHKKNNSLPTFFKIFKCLTHVYTLVLFIHEAAQLNTCFLLLFTVQNASFNMRVERSAFTAFTLIFKEQFEYFEVLRN